MRAAPYLSDAQNRAIRVAARHASPRPEDRADFVQWAHLLAWQKIVEKGMADRGPRTYIFDIKYVILEARRALFETQRGQTDNRPAERLAREDWAASFDRRLAEPLAELLKYCVPANERDWAVERKWKIRLQNGMTILLSYDELAELRASDRHSMIASRCKGGNLPVWVYDGRIYPSPSALQEACGLTPWQAKTRAQKVSMSWAS